MKHGKQIIVYAQIYSNENVQYLFLSGDYKMNDYKNSLSSLNLHYYSLLAAYSKGH